MFRSICFSFIALTVASSCLDRQTTDGNALLEPIANRSVVTIGKLEKVELPFDGEVAVKTDDGIMVLGNDQMALLDNNGVAAVPLKYKVVTQRSIDGNLKIRDNRDWIPDPQLCSPWTGVFTGSSFVVYAQCDHSDQMWRIIRKGDIAEVDLISFPYWMDKRPEILLMGVTGTSGRLFLMTDRNKVPALFEVDEKTWSVRIAWQGKAADGQIESVIFVKKDGFMLLSDGSLFRTTNEGQNWDRVSQVFSESSFGKTEMEFRNAGEGLAVSKGRLFSTTDEGKTWTRDEAITVSEGHNPISADGDRVILVVGNGRIAYRVRPATEWVTQEVFPSLPIENVTLNDRQLVLFSNGIPYRASFVAGD